MLFRLFIVLLFRNCIIINYFDLIFYVIYFLLIWNQLLYLYILVLVNLVIFISFVLYLCIDVFLFQFV